MSKVSYSQARAQLKKVCAGYLSHKKNQLDSLMGSSRSIPEFTFFYQALAGRGKPQRGFNDWVRCKYFHILAEIFWEARPLVASLSDGKKKYMYTISGYRQVWLEIGEAYYPYGYLKSFQEKHDALDQHDPQLVLHNLKALIGLLNAIMVDCDKGYSQLKEQSYIYKANDYTYPADAPLSLQIEKTLKEFMALTRFIANIPVYQDDLSFSYLSICLEKAYPIFETYLKYIAVQELETILNDSSLNDEEALSRVKTQIGSGFTLELLERNRQSASEQRLKLLSVISICLGIGIFTTLGLVMKRLYDSGGSSINFFKPLSKNVCEDVEEILAHTCNAPNQ